MICHIGIDDADSRLGGCTTYVAWRVVEQLIEQRANFTDFPNLIRLNPNIPWKTKGNAALSLRFLTEDPDRNFETVAQTVLQNSEVENGSANPGVVMFTGEEIPYDVNAFSEQALTDVVSSKQALSLVATHQMKVASWGNRMGVVGAVAAIGNELHGDYTYELLAYRRRENWGTRRGTDFESVIQMDRETYPLTFNNYDSQTNRILITPRGPDPVLFGVRGEDPQTLLRASSMLRLQEPVEGFLIYRTNQGTGAHLSRPLNSARPKAFTSGYIAGEVSKVAKVTQGGHVFFTIQNEIGEAICAVYEPTGDLRKVAMKLSSGDLIRVGGGVRPRSRNHPTVLNVEYIQILSTRQRFRLVNPICSSCGKRMTSMGTSKGYRCRHCGNRSGELQKTAEVLPPELEEGLYLPSLRAQRHLTKPRQRFGLEKTDSETPHPSGRWYLFSSSTSQA